MSMLCSRLKKKCKQDKLYIVSLDLKLPLAEVSTLQVPSSQNIIQLAILVKHYSLLQSLSIISHLQDLWTGLRDSHLQGGLAAAFASDAFVHTLSQCCRCREECSYAHTRASVH